MYFQGSVSGLAAGSAVNFRGVRLGQVANVYIRYQPDNSEPLLIPVLAELNADNVQLVAKRAEKKEICVGSGDTLRGLIDQGLRAQLAVPSLVTGQATVSLDMFPGTPANFVDTYPDRVEIPTVPSTLQEMQSTLQQIYDKLSQLPLDELVEDTRDADRRRQPPGQRSHGHAGGRQRRSGDDGFAAGSADARRPHRTGARQHRDDLRRGEPNPESPLEKGDRWCTDAMLQAAQRALAQADRTLKTADSVIQPGGPANYELINALRETAAARPLSPGSRRSAAAQPQFTAVRAAGGASR